MINCCLRKSIESHQKYHYYQNLLPYSHKSYKEQYNVYDWDFRNDMGLQFVLLLLLMYQDAVPDNISRFLHQLFYRIQKNQR